MSPFVILGVAGVALVMLTRKKEYAPAPPGKVRIALNYYPAVAPKDREGAAAALRESYDLTSWNGKKAVVNLTIPQLKNLRASEPITMVGSRTGAKHRVTVSLLGG